MNVKRAKEVINEISEVCDLLLGFDEDYADASENYRICDAVQFLGDYKRILEKAIDSAEIKLGGE